MQNKPFSFLSPSTSPLGNKQFAVDLLTNENCKHTITDGRKGPRDIPGLTCIGRLDADSTGLMLWTTDQTFASRVMSPETRVEKECVLGKAAIV